MQKIIKYLSYFFYLLVSLIFLLYLSLPDSGIPSQIPNSLISPEPADRAFENRPAYFTYSNRRDTLSYYEKIFSRSPFNNVYIPTYRLNYPPEDSSFLVRPHMYSSYLEEIVHPFRESIYINGFKPTRAQDEIWIYGVNYDEKITLKYVSSPTYTRLMIGFLTVITLFITLKVFYGSVSRLLSK